MFVFINVLTRCMLDVVILVNLFSNILLTLIVNHYLLYGSDVITWNKSDLSSISHAFNSAMCKIYKVKYESLACIYRFTGPSDIVHDIFRTDATVSCIICIIVIMRLLVI